MRRFVFAMLPALGLGLVPASAWGQTPRAAEVMSSAAQAGRFTFVMFWKQTDDPSDAMAAALEARLKPYADRAVFTSAQVSDPADEPLVKRFGLARAPLPLVLAIAPNGAVTGVFNAPPSEATVEKAFVTPIMSVCMKAMQEGKVVVVCADPTGAVEAPLGTRQFLGDPQYDGKLVFVRLATAAPDEARLVKELQLDPQSPAPVTVVMAPPGVLIGKFGADVTHSALAAKLHAAGKCCDDENCIHNHAPAKAK